MTTPLTTVHVDGYSIDLDATSWKPGSTAPKDGQFIEAKDIGQPDEEADVICWQEQRTCMLASVAPGAGQCGPGWVSKLAGHLPVDPPGLWRQWNEP